MNALQQKLHDKFKIQIFNEKKNLIVYMIANAEI